MDKTARAARDIGDDTFMERITEIRGELEDSLDAGKEAADKESTSANDEDSNYESLPDEDDGLVDWAAVAWTVDDNESSSRDEYSASIRVIEGSDNMLALRTLRADEGPKELVAFRHRATKDLRTEKGPKRNYKNPGVMEGFIRIGEVKAHVLLDCGSTLDMVSANYVAMSKLDMFQLEKPVRLQMATSGSRTTIQFGVRV